jgi:hypothetical protein
MVWQISVYLDREMMRSRYLADIWIEIDHMQCIMHPQVLMLGILAIFHLKLMSWKNISRPTIKPARFDEFDAFKWWATNLTAYPILSRSAFEIVSIVTELRSQLSQICRNSGRNHPIRKARRPRSRRGGTASGWAL